MPTTAGVTALKDYYPKANAVIVDRLLATGLVILGKTTTSEMAGCKSDALSCGWSALHGQAQSAFVCGGVQQDGRSDIRVQTDRNQDHASPSVWATHPWL